MAVFGDDEIFGSQAVHGLVIGIADDDINDHTPNRGAEGDGRFAGGLGRSLRRCLI